MHYIRLFKTKQEYDEFYSTSDVLYLPFVCYIEDADELLIKRSQDETAYLDDEGNMYINDTGDAIIQMLEINNTPYMYIKDGDEINIYTASGSGTVITDD